MPLPPMAEFWRGMRLGMAKVRLGPIALAVIVGKAVFTLGAVYLVAWIAKGGQ